MRILVIGHTLPEPLTTGAGFRMIQLLQGLSKGGHEMHFATAATQTDLSDPLEGIASHKIALNHDTFDVFIHELNPEVVIYDRFMTEEQYGWRVAEQCPDALRILDTEDLHFLRYAREKEVKGDSTQGLLNFDDRTKRELASILRCDLSLIISEEEYRLLSKDLRISAQQLCYLPPWVDVSRASNNFAERQDLIMLGNLKHAPNVDAVRYMHSVLWPKIKKALPGVSLRIYGAYAPPVIQQLHSPNKGFFVQGWARDIHSELAKARLNLCAVRFGAGLKIKILDAMSAGTPSVTTEVGAEGIAGEMTFPGRIATSDQDFVDDVFRLYTDEQEWINASGACVILLKARFSRERHDSVLNSSIRGIRDDLDGHRRRNFIIELLQHQSLQSTKYMSKWITEKNRPT